MWLGEIVMGGTTTFDVVYDTGSDWLVIDGVDCSSCEGNKYNPLQSDAEPVKTSNSLTERNYGSASLTGYTYTDRVCLNPGACVEDFEFFLI